MTLLVLLQLSIASHPQSLVVDKVIYDLATDTGFHKSSVDSEIHTDSNGNIYVGTRGGIRVLAPDYSLVRTITLNRFNNDKYEVPVSFAVTPSGNVYVVVRNAVGANRLDCYSKNGIFDRQIGINNDSNAFTPQFVTSYSDLVVVTGYEHNTPNSSLIVSIDDVTSEIKSKYVTAGYVSSLALAKNNRLFFVRNSYDLYIFDLISKVETQVPKQATKLFNDVSGDVYSTMSNTLDLLGINGETLYQFSTNINSWLPHARKSNGRFIFTDYVGLHEYSPDLSNNSLVYGRSALGLWHDEVQYLNASGPAVVTKGTSYPFFKILTKAGALVELNVSTDGPVIATSDNSISGFKIYPIDFNRTLMSYVQTWNNGIWIDSPTPLNLFPSKLILSSNQKLVSMSYKLDGKYYTKSDVELVQYSSNLHVDKSISSSRIRELDGEKVCEFFEVSGRFYLFCSSGKVVVINNIGGVERTFRLRIPMAFGDGIQGSVWYAGTNNFISVDSSTDTIYFYDLDGNYLGSVRQPTADIMFCSADSQGNVYVKTLYDLVKYRITVTDNVPPLSTHSLSPTPTEFGWTRAATTLTITSTDKAPSAGFKELRYTVDSGAEQVTTQTTKALTFDDGVHQIAYWAADNAGNIEATQYAAVRVDKVRPVTSRNVNATDSLVTLTASDNASGVATTSYSIDGAPQQQYTAPITLDGKQHRIVYWSVDKAGNVEYVNTVLIGVALKSVTLDRTTAVGGFTRTGRVNLTGPAPAGGVDVLVWSDNSAATVPVSVTIPVGQSSATFEITTQPVAENTIVTLSATAGDNTRFAQLDLIPPSARISATPRTVIGGETVTLSVTLDGPAPTGGTVVNLSSDNATVLPVPGTVTVAEGQTSASVQVTSVPTPERSTVIISASTASQSAMTTVLVDAPSPVSVSLTPTAVNGGSGSVGTVTLNGPAPVGGYEVALASSSAVATVPASLVIAAGQTTGTFDISTRGVQQNTTVTITATANNVRKMAVLTVRTAAVASVQVTPATVLGSQSAVGRVNLTTPAPDGGLVVDLTSNNTNVIVPATVRVPAGETSATFDVQTKSVTAQAVATITATFNGASKTANLTVNGLVLQNLTVSAAAVTGGNGLTATVSLTAPAPAGGVVVALTSSNAAVTVPATVTVAAGQTTATVDISTVAVASNTNVTLTAALLGVSKTASVTVMAPGLSRLTLNPASVVGGNTTTATVDIASSAPVGGLVIALSSNRSDVLAPATVTVPAGQTSVSFQVPTRTVLSQVDAVVTATLNGVSRTANLSLTAPALTSIALNPSTIRGGDDAVLTVNLTSPAPIGGVTVTLASTNAALVVPASVTVPAGETTVKVTLGTRPVTATENGQLNATFAGVTKSVQVSVVAPVMASLTVEPNAVVGGSSATGTLELTSVAPAGGLVVSLTSSKSDVGVPVSVTVPAGLTSVTFNIQTNKVIADVTSVITAGLNGNTRTAQIRVVAHQLATVAVSPSSVSGGTSFTGRVTLQQAAPAGGIVVSLASSDSAVSVSSTVTIDAGKTTATFAGSTAAVMATKNVTITASLNGNSVTDSLRVVQPAIKAISLSPSTLTGGTGSQLTITLDAPAPSGGWVVNLSSSDSSATLATTATVVAGQMTITVPVTTKSVLTRTAVTLTATDASGSQATTLVVDPVIGLQLRLSSSSIAGGNSVNLTVELAEAAPKTGATVALSADNAALIVPVSVKVLAGSKTATIAVKSLAVAADTTVRIAGTVNGFTDRAQIVVTAPRPQSIAFAPAAVLGGKPATGTLTLTGLAPVGGLTVQLTSDNAAAAVSATVLVPAGKNLVTFIVTTKAVASRTPATISAAANGVTVTQQLAVQALTVQSVVMKPVTVVGGTPAIGTITLNGVAPAGGLQVDLSSTVVGVTVPTKVFVPAGKNIVTFTATTEPVGSNLEATLTARANGDQATTTLLVTPVLVSSLTVAPTTVVGGTSATGTVKLAVAPGIDTVVTLSSANPTIASVPASVIVKKGSLTATFTVTTKKPAAQTAVTLSAVTGGAAKTGTLTVKP